MLRTQRSIAYLLVIPMLLAGWLLLADPVVAGGAAEIACEGIEGSGCDAAAGETSIGNIVGSVVNILAIFIGVASVIVILLSGFKYITSSGDAASVKSARDTLLYAVVGLAIALLTMLIINFVVGSVGDGAGGSSGGGGPSDCSGGPPC